jgi:hypothetical protein
MKSSLVSGYRNPYPGKKEILVFRWFEEFIEGKPKFFFANLHDL